MFGRSSLNLIVLIFLIRGKELSAIIVPRSFFLESELGTSNLKRYLSTCAKRSSVPIMGSDKEVDQGVYREKLAMAIM
jgi:hypothetical protein